MTHAEICYFQHTWYLLKNAANNISNLVKLYPKVRTQVDLRVLHKNYIAQIQMYTIRNSTYLSEIFCSGKSYKSNTCHLTSSCGVFVKVLGPVSVLLPRYALPTQSQLKTKHPIFNILYSPTYNTYHKLGQFLLFSKILIDNNNLS